MLDNENYLDYVRIEEKIATTEAKRVNFVKNHQDRAKNINTTKFMFWYKDFFLIKKIDHLATEIDY